MNDKVAYKQPPRAGNLRQAIKENRATEITQVSLLYPAYRVESKQSLTAKENTLNTET